MPVLAPLVRHESDPIDTQSPYWLRVEGMWVRLQGVTPGSQRTAERARSVASSVDGHRYVQQAPRSVREWALDFTYATPASLSVLEYAVDVPGGVWMLDDAAARANMVDPATSRGTGSAVDCGGVPLRTLAGDISAVTVRGLVATTVALWTTQPAGATVATLDYPGGTTTLLAPAGTGARQASTVIAATTDGPLAVSVDPDTAAGLMVLEDTAPPMWLAGQRTPCKVSVLDPARTLRLTPTGRATRSEYSLTLQEVG